MQNAEPRPAVNGLHHVTAIAGDPQENVDFYTGVLATCCALAFEHLPGQVIGDKYALSATFYRRLIGAHKFICRF